MMLAAFEHNMPPNHEVGILQTIPKQRFSGKLGDVTQLVYKPPAGMMGPRVTLQIAVVTL